MTELQYLESLDSTRMTAKSLGSVESEAESLQVFLDVIVALSLGRDIVVPQAYALDSTAFIRVASSLIGAHNRRLTQPQPGSLPIRLHLYNQPSYRAATASMLRRMDEPGHRKFVSSFLEYDNLAGSGHATRVAEQIERGDSPQLLFELAPTDLQQALERVWGVLSSRRAGGRGVTQEQRQEFPNLPETVPALTDSSSPVRRVLAAEGFTQRDEVNELLTALARLHSAGGTASFENRSPIHSTGPWPNDSLHRSALDIVGDSNLLRMTKECIDTLYNARIAGTIGVSTSIFATNVITGGQALSGISLAQEVALTHYEVLRRQRLGLSLDADLREAEISADPLPPTFEITTSSEAKQLPERSLRVFRALQKKADEVFSEILELRAEDTDFQESVARLDQLLLERDQGKIASHLDSHARLLSRRLAGLATTSSLNGWLKVSIMGGSAASSGLLAGAVSNSVLLTALTAATSAAAADIWEQGKRSLNAQRIRRSIAYGMGHLISVHRRIPR